jgi:hypothetical protein
VSIDTTKLCNGAATVSVKGAGETYDVGSLGSGVELTYEPEFLMIQPQQSMAAVKAYKTSEGWVAAFTIWEPTLKNIDFFLFGGDGTYAGGSSEEFGGDDTPEELEPVVIYGTAPGGFVRTIQFDKMVAIEPGGYPIDRTASHGYPAKLRALVDPATGTFGYVEDATS